MTNVNRRSKIIAEIGVNHDGSIAKATQLIDAALSAGADAVKFQSFTAKELASDQAQVAAYQIGQVRHKSQQDMLENLELDRDAFRQLKDYCDISGIEFISTAFDHDWLEFLLELGIGTIKWPSGELTNHSFLEFAAKTGIPLLLSTGMATLHEVEQAAGVVRNVWLKSGGPSFEDALTILHCTSLYPAPAHTLNLSAISTLRRELGVNVGYSDHSTGIYAGPTAVALGATVFEKHLTLDRAALGPDHAASVEPAELEQYVRAIRWAEDAMGSGIKEPHELEADTALAARKSVFALRAIEAGETLTEDCLVLRRPGNGIGADELVALYGRRLNRAIASGEQLTWSHLE